MAPHASRTARRTWFPLLVCCVLVRSSILFAQSTSGAIAGSVVDEQLAAVGAATVTLSNPDTARNWSTQTDAAGEYRFIAIPPGRYVLLARHPGFDPATVAEFTLHINHDLRVRLILRVARVTQSVTVPAPALIERGTSVGRTTTRDEIDGLPVADRDFANLALLAPGVLENATNPGTSTGIVAAGQTGRNNTFLLDGLTLDQADNGNIRGNVPLDAIAEFDVQTGGFAPEFGQATGAVLLTSLGLSTHLLAQLRDRPGHVETTERLKEAHRALLVTCSDVGESEVVYQQRRAWPVRGRYRLHRALQRLNCLAVPLQPNTGSSDLGKRCQVVRLDGKRAPKGTDRVFDPSGFESDEPTLPVGRRHFRRLVQVRRGAFDDQGAPVAVESTSPALAVITPDRAQCGHQRQMDRVLPLLEGLSVCAYE